MRKCERSPYSLHVRLQARLHTTSSGAIGFFTMLFGDIYRARHIVGAMRLSAGWPG